MQVDWENMFKRYVFNESKTPYFVAPAKLNRVQANNEIFFYCFLQTVMFAVLSIASISPSLPHAGAPIVTACAFILCASAIIFGATKHPAAAATLALAPVCGLAYFLAYGFHPRIGEGDRILLVLVMLAWLRYNWRVLAIARAYPDLPEPPPPAPPPST